MRNLKNKKLNNDKGFSFLLVILAMSFVAILIAVMLMLTYQNYMMKHTSLKSEDNFYTAEHVLDEIKAGLQSDISSSVSDAYNYVLERYSETEGQDATRNWHFQTKYVDSLRAKLLDDTDVTKVIYDLELLRSYVQKTDDNGTVELAMQGDNNTLTTNYSSGVTLKGLKVTYTDAKGYVSIISTDLRLAIPAVDFTQTSNSPDLLSYCVVAEEGIVLPDNVGNYKLQGSVYAGENGIHVGKAANLTLQDGERVIAKDGIVLDSGATLNYSGDSLWTADIDIKDSNFTATGNVFVQDDMTLDGLRSSSILSGRYYGFSNPTLIETSNVYKDGFIDTQNASANSSAIVVNGRQSTLNLENLESIFIAGNSYINARKTETDPGALAVQMGESISVKGNQLAYLAPEAAIVIANGGSTTGGNPIMNLAGGATVTLNTNIRLVELGGKTLASLGIGPEDCQLYYLQENLAYVYMKFDSDLQAAEYFNAYYGEDISKYTNLYLESFVMNEESMVNVALNGSAFEKDTNTVLSQTDRNETQAEANGYQDMFYAFCKKLIPTYTSLTNEEKSVDATVFDNLVIENRTGDNHKLTQYVATNGSGNQFKFTTRENELEAILVNGDFTINDSTVTDKTRLIVATGDVSLAANKTFKGVIICQGKFTMGANSSVVEAQEDVTAVFQCVFRKNAAGDSVATPNEVAPMSFFREGQDYILDGIASGAVSDSMGSIIELTDLIVYENWKKQ